MTLGQKAVEMKALSPMLAATSIETRNAALRAVADSLQANKQVIFEANEKDLNLADIKGVADQIVKRLKFGEEKLADVISGIESLIELPDPLNRTLIRRELDEGLVLNQVTCPIGVIGVIFESRPDAMVQVSTLCIKSGNCAILKGGSEAEFTNAALFKVISEAAYSAGIPEGALLQAVTHADIEELLWADQYIDLLIPRGSNTFVKYIMDNTNIPVMGHADGKCSTYVDKDADLEKAVRILVDAKVQYPAACNATENIFIHSDIAGKLVPEMARAMKENGVQLRGTPEIMALTEDCVEAEEEAFDTEYLDLIVSATTVENMDEAIDFINRHGSHHTDAIITENDQAAEKFMQLVDSAGVYRNCSTRFADGYRYGFGAEVGISTGKLHARGPVGLDGLVTYKYKLYGDGHIVGDYAAGRRQFHFKDL